MKRAQRTHVPNTQTHLYTQAHCVCARIYTVYSISRWFWLTLLSYIPLMGKQRRPPFFRLIKTFLHNVMR